MKIKTALLLITSLAVSGVSAVWAEESNTASTASAIEVQSTTEAQAADFIETVNINTADAQTLAKMLNGVGEVKAKAIIEFREQHGPFKSAEELAQVQGIGEALIAKNKNLIVFE